MCLSWPSHARPRVWRKNEADTRKEVGTMAHVENSNRGFERERYYRDHRTERGHKDGKDGKDGGDRQDW